MIAEQSNTPTCWSPLGPLGQLVDGLFDLDEFKQTEQIRQTADWSLKTKMVDQTNKIDDYLKLKSAPELLLSLILRAGSK